MAAPALGVVKPYSDSGKNGPVMGKKEKRVGSKKRALVQRNLDSSKSWYFLRLAFLAIPWVQRNKRNPKGTLFKQYYLLHAKDLGSAWNKASRILSVSEHLDGDGRLNGKRVIFKRIGILDLDPLYERLENGTQLFAESETDVGFAEIKRQVINSKRMTRMLTFEKRKGKPDLLDVYWGDDFDRL